MYSINYQLFKNIERNRFQKSIEFYSYHVRQLPIYFDAPADLVAVICGVRRGGAYDLPCPQARLDCIGACVNIASLSDVSDSQ